MGMYTEISFSAELKLDTETAKVVATLSDYESSKAVKDDFWPDHKFFKTSRFRQLMVMSSAYFPGTIHPLFRRESWNEDMYTLIFRSNLKNYDDEIELFLDWIKPYIYDGCGTRGYYAVVCYEEAAEPTIYYLR